MSVSPRLRRTTKTTADEGVVVRPILSNFEKTSANTFSFEVARARGSRGVSSDAPVAMGVGRSKPLDTDPRCRTLAPVWSPFVDAFVDTLHAQGAAVHPPPPRRTGIFSARTPRASGGAADDEDAAETATRDAKRHKFRSPGRPGPVFRSAAERLVAIGDLHGDLAKAREAFRAGGLTDADGRWIGGRTVAVQVGDQLDRGGDEVAIMYMLERLRAEARDAGGELIVMNGNHETLNAAGRFRYAKPAGAEDFRRWRGRQLFGAALKAKCGERPGQCTLLGAESAAAAVERGRRGYPTPPQQRAVSATVAAESDARGRPPSPPPGSSRARIHGESSEGSWMPRLAALAPGGPMATRFLAHQPVVVAVGSTVFAHGGVLERHAAYGLDRVNRETSDWISGRKEGAPPVHVTGGDSVVWARHYSHPEEYRCDCVALENALAAVGGGARRVVVGHTIQGDAGVNAACDGRVIRVDVGMSAGCGGYQPQVLEILEDGTGGISRLSWDAGEEKVVREPVPGADGTPRG